MYATDIKRQTKDNNAFRRVLHTGEHSQLVAMCLVAGEDIGMETHEGSDQMLFIVEGEGEAIVGGDRRPIEEHDVVFVPAGTEHNIINSGYEPMKLFTVYAPATHPDGTLHETKADAIKAEQPEQASMDNDPKFASAEYYGAWLPVR